MFAILFIVVLILIIPIIVVSMSLKTRKSSPWLKNGLLGLGVGLFLGLALVTWIPLNLINLFPEWIFKLLATPFCVIPDLFIDSFGMADCGPLEVFIFSPFVVAFYGIVGLIIGLIITMFKKR